MITLYSADEKLGLLLHLLGDRAAEQGLGAIAAERAANIRRFMKELREDPPSSEEIRFVLDDFEKYFRFALNNLQQSPPRESDSQGEERTEKGGSAAAATDIIAFPQLPVGSDPAADLARLDPWQVASALSADQPRTVALILSQLPAEIAGPILQFLPEALRTAAFVFLSQPQSIPRAVVQTLLKTTFQKANAIRERRVEINHVGKIVDLVRSLPKDVRNQLMTRLMETDENFANAVREKMYRFDDILRLDDRGIQSVLSKIPSQTLVMAMTRAPENLSSRILGNLSKRARATIEEEISFNEQAPEAEVEVARAEIAQVLGKMDEAGEVNL